MTIRRDIEQARMAFNRHCFQHGCKPMGCDERQYLWLAYQKTGERWGRDPDDKQRAREVYGGVAA